MRSADRRTDPVICALLLTARDVTERIELQERLAHQATLDELTALPNRAAALACGSELLTARRAGEHVAVALLDLDRLKELNDTLGHGYGDRLLAQVGPRLRPHVRDVDVVARLGGDEFLLLLPDLTPEGSRLAAERIRAALNVEALAQVRQWTEQGFHVPVGGRRRTRSRTCACDVGQGCLFGVPVAAAGMTGWLADRLAVAAPST